MGSDHKPFSAFRVCFAARRSDAPQAGKPKLIGYMPKRVIDGFEIYVYLRGERGHRPHVHVFGSTGGFIAWLDPVMKRANRGMKMSEARRALRVVREHQDELLELWRRYHGH